jgi:WD40 repeat protein
MVERILPFFQRGDKAARPRLPKAWPDDLVLCRLSSSSKDTATLADAKTGVLITGQTGSQQVGQPLAEADSVKALTVAECQGRPVIVSGSNDGSIRIWDLDRARQVREPLTGHPGSVDALAIAERKGRTVIVSGT